MSDSFADLWNTSAPSYAKPKPQNQTLAARLAEERKRQHHTVELQSSHKAPDASHAAWAGLDSLDSGSVKVKVDDVDDDWGLRDFGAAVKSDDHNNLIGGGGILEDEDIFGSGSIKLKDDDVDDDWGLRDFGAAVKSDDHDNLIGGAGIHLDEEDIFGGGSIKLKADDVYDDWGSRDFGSTVKSDDHDDLIGGGAGKGSRPPSPPPHILLLSQASEIGLSVLTRASAFWKEGKEKVVKVIEERSGGAGTSTGVGIEESGRWKNVDASQQRPPLSQRPSQLRTHSRPQRTHPSTSSSTLSFAYTDKNDGGAGTSRERVEIEESGGWGSVDFSQERPPLSQRPSQLRTHSRPQRTLPTTSSSTLSLASTHKNNGTSQFKLGQYGPASESYTSAITLLPPGHLLLVPLYTNRSLARLRCGEYVGAGEDAGEALKIICVVDSKIDPNSNNWNPDTELPELIQGGRDKLNQGGWLDARGVGVDLLDGYVKALRRRAEAWEGREKWIEAGKDWEILAGGGGGVSGGWIGEGIKKEAVRGAGRCRKMVSAGGQESIGSSSSSAPKQYLPPKPKLKKPSPQPPSSSQPSKALLAHQATTLQAEADDTLKHQLKDSVDARISAWKNGKETNIRALLASLDMVLWEEILSGGVKVNGLGELVTNVQVKKGYMKAIARVHPDKVKFESFCLLINILVADGFLFSLPFYNRQFNTSNSTVEQRMLANSVFAALNEAWIAFQSGK